MHVTQPTWPDWLRARLYHTKPPYSTWLGRYCVLAAWLGLALAIFSPPHGSGFALCWVQGATGVPCPGCGMTRSLSCALRGMFAESWSYHPFGLFVLALFLITAAQSLLTKAARDQIASYMQARAPFFNGFYLAFVIAFIGFGVVRALVHCAQHL